jgi:hypothetical protein
MKPTFHYLLLVRWDWKIHHHLCGITLKVKAEAILCVLCAPTSISVFGAHLAKVYYSYREVHAICENSHDSSETV